MSSVIRAFPFFFFFTQYLFCCLSSSQVIKMSSFQLHRNTKQSKRNKAKKEGKYSRHFITILLLCWLYWYLPLLCTLGHFLHSERPIQIINYFSSFGGVARHTTAKFLCFFFMGISWISLNVTSYLPWQSTVVKTEDNMGCSDTQFSMTESKLEDTLSTQENTVDSTVCTQTKKEKKAQCTQSHKVRNYVKLKNMLQL